MNYEDSVIRAGEFHSTLRGLADKAGGVAATAALLATALQRMGCERCPEPATVLSMPGEGVPHLFCFYHSHLHADADGLCVLQEVIDV